MIDEKDLNSNFNSNWGNSNRNDELIEGTWAKKKKDEEMQRQKSKYVEVVDWEWGNPTNREEEEVININDQTNYNTSNNFPYSTKNLEQHPKNNNFLNDSAPVISIKEKIYPVHVFYLDLFVKRLGIELGLDFSTLNFNFDKKMPKIDIQLYEICAYLVRNIHAGNVFPEKGMKYTILIFLPGYGEILSMEEIIYSKLSPTEIEEMDILHLHSNLTE